MTWPVLRWRKKHGGWGFRPKVSCFEDGSPILLGDFRATSDDRNPKCGIRWLNYGQLYQQTSAILPSLAALCSASAPKDRGKGSLCHGPRDMDQELQIIIFPSLAVKLDKHLACFRWNYGLEATGLLLLTLTRVGHSLGASLSPFGVCFPLHSSWGRVARAPGFGIFGFNSRRETAKQVYFLALGGNEPYDGWLE